MSAAATSEQQPSRFGAWPLWLMLAATISFLSCAIVGFVRTELFLHRAVETTGTLDGISSLDGHIGTTFHFYTKEGQHVSIASPVTVRATGMPHPGDRIPVYYDPANPQDAQVALWAWLWLGPTILGGMGGTFAIVLIAFRWMATH